MKNVKIYTAKDSSPSQKAKAYFKDRKVNFQEVDVVENEDEAQNLVQKTGFSSLPQIDIDGQIIVGYDPKKIDELLQD